MLRYSCTVWNHTHLHTDPRSLSTHSIIHIWSLSSFFNSTTCQSAWLIDGRFVELFHPLWPICLWKSCKLNAARSAFRKTSGYDNQYLNINQSVSSLAEMWLTWLMFRQWNLPSIDAATSTLCVFVRHTNAWLINILQQTVFYCTIIHRLVDEAFYKMPLAIHPRNKVESSSRLTPKSAGELVINV